MAFVTGFLTPTLIPYFAWGEDLVHSFAIAALARYCISLHGTWLVNSAAHIWGARPYDVSIGARENSYVIVAAIGEGYHNYHHTFPWDYATSEYGTKWNMTAWFIERMAAIGQAYQLKTTSPSMIEARVRRTGDRMCDRNGGKYDDECEREANVDEASAECESGNGPHGPKDPKVDLNGGRREPNFNCIDATLETINTKVHDD